MDPNPPLLLHSNQGSGPLWFYPPQQHPLQGLLLTWEEQREVLSSLPKGTGGLGSASVPRGCSSQLIVTFDRLEEPIGPRLPALGREGQQRGREGDGGRSKGSRKKGHTMYRSSWRNCTDDAMMGGTCLEEKKNLQGLCFYIYNPTRQAEL